MAHPALEVNKDLLTKIERLASRGMSMPNIASVLGISEGTFYEYKKKYPQINEAWRKGKYKGISEVANAIYSKAIDEGSVDAMKFILGRQGGKEWREEMDINLIPKPTIIKRFGSDEQIVLGTEEPHEE